MRTLVTFLCLFLIGCGKTEGPPVKIIVPDNYELGKKYYIVLDKNNGELPKEENGVFIYDYTEPGKTYNTFKHFRPMHTEYIVTESGKVIWGIDGPVDKTLSVEQGNQTGTLKRKSDGSYESTGGDDGAVMYLVITRLE